jgi:hypothetical protein
MSYIILRSHWFLIIVLNVHALTEDKIDIVKGNFYKELEFALIFLAEYASIYVCLINSLNTIQEFC